ncbi:hypothetical protein ES703_87127 [subsurface metagenome]
MGNIQLDFEQLDKWPPSWQCKECGELTNLFVIEEAEYRVLDKGESFYSLRYLRR